MIELLKRLLGDRSEREDLASARDRLVELDRRATDRDAFRAALGERDFERAAEYHEFSAGELRETYEEALQAVAEENAESGFDGGGGPGALGGDGSGDGGDGGSSGG